MLTSNGTRQFNQPGRYRASGPRQLASGGIGGRIGNGVAQTGVSRADPASSAMMRSVWQVDINETGNFCAPENGPVSLWRANASAAADVRITRVVDGERVILSFAEGEFSNPWPEGFETANGTYMIETIGSAAHTHMEMVPIGTDSDDSIAIGTALLENECNGQLDAFTTDYQLVDASAAERD